MLRSMDIISGAKHLEEGDELMAVKEAFISQAPGSYYGFSLV